MRVAKALFRSAKATRDVRPGRVTTDGRGFYRGAIRTALGRTVRHRTNVYLNNRFEQVSKFLSTPLKEAKLLLPKDTADGVFRFCRGTSHIPVIGGKTE
jgi:transposase-like protein